MRKEDIPRRRTPWVRVERARAQTPKHTPPRDVSRFTSFRRSRASARACDGPSLWRSRARSLLSRSLVVHSPSMANALIFEEEHRIVPGARVRQGTPRRRSVATRVVANPPPRARTAARVPEPLVRISRVRSLGPLLRPRQQSPERLPRSVPVRAASHGAPRAGAGVANTAPTAAKNAARRACGCGWSPPHRVTRDEFKRRPRECRRVRSISRRRATLAQRAQRAAEDDGVYAAARDVRGTLVVWMFLFLRGALCRGDARGVLLGAAKHRGGVREERYANAPPTKCAQVRRGAL